MSTVETLAGASFGLGGTVALREFADNPQDDRVTRPSVLFGVGAGTAAQGLRFAADQGRVNLPAPIEGMLMPFSIAALSAGLTSAFYPKGQQSASVPTVAVVNA